VIRPTHLFSYHDLLNDIGKEKVMADIQRWINARLRVV
jgi:hypothetical protein